jgi:small subunit ribosomal protein S16
MLKIRLQRTGRKHEPTFRVVLTDSQNSTKSGKFIEILGNHDARREQDTQLKADRILYWIGQGAQPSDTVHNLLVGKDIIKGDKRNVLPKKSPIIDEEAIKAQKEAEEKAKAEAEAQTEEAPAEESKEEEVKEETPAEEPKEEEKTEEQPAEEEKKEEAPAEESKEEEK